MLKTYIKASSWMASDEGATAVEYGIMVALIAVAIIATVVTLGTQLDAVFQSVVDELPAAPAAGG